MVNSRIFLYFVLFIFVSKHQKWLPLRGRPIHPRMVLCLRNQMFLQLRRRKCQKSLMIRKADLKPKIYWKENANIHLSQFAKKKESEFEVNSGPNWLGTCPVTTAEQLLRGQICHCPICNDGELDIKFDSSGDKDELWCFYDFDSINLYQNGQFLYKTL